jgi:hypothetical protein
MLIPLKNGVVLFSVEYSCYFRADLYLLKGYGWLFRVNNTRFYNDDDDPENVKVLVIDAWFDEFAIHGTMLVKDECCLFSDEFGREYLSGKEADRG